MAIELTDTQLGILRALCRPLVDGNRFATPATNQEIGEEVFLSVDAIKSHLRTLYRKFAIEDLPHNQKRARLVELVLEGGYLGDEAGEAPAPTAAAAEGEDDADPEDPPVATAPAAPPPAPPRRGAGRARSVRVAVAGVLLVAIAAAALAAAGVFDSGSAAKTTGLAAYRSEVRGYCELALAGGSSGPGNSRVARAQGYLEVIETVRGRLSSLPPPATSDEALERFRSGLSRAADFTSLVAQGPPPPGSREEANAVAELTFAAGQVQAGALGFDLGERCVAIGDLVARSAQNAAAP